MIIPHGPGLLADPTTPPERWGGRKAQRFTVQTLATYGTVCWICGLPGADTADHVIPKSIGGAVYDLTNLAPAHSRCNKARGNRPRVAPTIPIESGLAYFEGAPA